VLLVSSGYAAPGLVLPDDGLEQVPTSEWWVVGALLVVLVFFGSIGAWCWFVCGGHVKSCSADWWNKTVTAQCY
jgi:hypothetical protein